MSLGKRIALGLATGLLMAANAYAAPAYWTDWVSNGTANTLVGNIDVGGENVTVTFEGAYLFAQFGGDSTNYWIESAPYMSAQVDNAPSTTDIIALNQGGTATISFSRPVVDPLIALVSWNGNVVDFDRPIEFLSYGDGYWGVGTPTLHPSGMGFTGVGELHGVAQIIGTQSTFRMTHTSENWHGFTIGVQALAEPAAVPTPAPLALLGIGLTGLALVRRARR